MSSALKLRKLFSSNVVQMSARVTGKHEKEMTGTKVGHAKNIDVVYWRRHPWAH